MPNEEIVIPELTEAGKAARNAYHRKYAARHKLYQVNYWNKKGAEMLEAERRAEAEKIKAEMQAKKNEN